jgi:phenylalanyl-tRNA synthetase, alpha subunit
MRNLRYVSDLSDFHQVFSATLGKMAAVQGRFADIVGNLDWNVDFDRCEIAFGDQIYKIQFIGSESNVSDTWLWGFANQSGLSPEATAFSHEILRAGREWGLQAFSKPGFELDEMLNGHNLSIAACGAVGENLCYYGCRHDKGCAFVAITDAPDLLFEPLSAHEFVKISSGCIQNHDVDHKIFIKSFLEFNGVKFVRGYRK